MSVSAYSLPSLLSPLEPRQLLAVDLTSDLVAHWSFDDPAAPAADTTGNHPATLNASPQHTTLGQRGGALQFDGSSDSLTIPNHVDINGTIHTQRTIALWFNADTLTGRQALYEEGGSIRGLSIYLENDTLYARGWNDQASESNWAGTSLTHPSLTANAWTHVAITLNGGASLTADAFSLYVNGSLIASGQGSQLWAHNGDINLANANDTLFHDTAATGPAYFDGRLDEAYLYNRALDALDIASLASLPPSANDDLFTTDEDTPLSGSVATNDADPEAGPLTFSLLTAPTLGTLTLNPDGSFDYSPALDANGNDQFTYTLTDDAGLTDTATASLSLTAINDRPTASDITFSFDEDTPLAANLSSQTNDVDGDHLTYTLVSPPARGSLSLNTNGTFSYTPQANDFGTLTFVYRVTDPSGATADAAVTLDLAPVNDAPITLDLNVTLIAGFQSTLDLNELAEDIDGDPLSFRLLNPTPFTDRFVRVSSLGAFILASPKEFFTRAPLEIEVSDGLSTTVLKLNAEAIPMDTSPPETPPASVRAQPDNPAAPATPAAAAPTAAVATAAPPGAADTLRLPSQTSASSDSAEPSSQPAATPPDDLTAPFGHDNWLQRMFQYALRVWLIGTVLPAGWYRCRRAA